MRIFSAKEGQEIAQRYKDAHIDLGDQWPDSLDDVFVWLHLGSYGEVRQESPGEYSIEIGATISKTKTAVIFEY